MQIIKPQTLGLSFRPMAFRKRFGLSVSGYLHVPFAQPAQGCLWGEQSMWNFLGAEMAVPLIDEGIAKLTPEFLVHGRAFAAPERPEAVAVRARLGGTSKTLLAFGERYWDGDAPSAPAPMRPLALDWPNAYGGADFAENPSGRGRQATDRIRWLPALEYPGDRLRRPDQAVAPAAFAPLDVLHPQRAALRGTYDANWLKEHAPGYAPDLNWQHFNMAPRDQWIDAPLRGDETYELDHMHPERPHIEGRLPGLRVRAFAHYRMGEGDSAVFKLREIPMRLTTVWFFPAAQRMVLVFHGLAETAEDDASDIHDLLGAVERIDPAEARTGAHYLSVLEKRTRGRDAALEALNDGDLQPEGLDTADPSLEALQAVMKSQGLQEAAQYRRAQVEVQLARDFLQSKGRDPDALGVRLAPREKPPTAAEMPAYLKKLREQMDAQRWAALDDAATHAETAIAFARKHKPAAEKLQHRGPPLFSAKQQLAELEGAHRTAGKPFDRARIGTALWRMQNSLHVDYLQTAHLQAAAVPLAGEAAAASRREVAFLLRSHLKRWPGIDLTGADLSNLDLRGVDFTGAWLESANLRNANLSGAKLQATVLAHADLRGAIAIGTDFRAANLGGAECAQAVFDNANLQGAILGGTRLGLAQLRGARLAQAQWLDSVWAGADASAIVAPGMLFYKLDMSGARFAEAVLANCSFIECNLQGADFSGADLGAASLVGCNAANARFVGARMAGAVVVKTTRLAGADFTGAMLANANLGECDLSGARLARANLAGANFGMGLLSDSDLRLANAKGALFRKAGLQRARLAGANFHDAILQSADLRGADLREANLFGADLSRVRLDGDAKFDGALLERARIHPRLTPEQHAGGR